MKNVRRDLEGRMFNPAAKKIRERESNDHSRHLINLFAPDVDSRTQSFGLNRVRFLWPQPLAPQRSKPEHQKYNTKVQVVGTQTACGLHKTLVSCVSKLHILPITVLGVVRSNHSDHIPPHKSPPVGCGTFKRSKLWRSRVIIDLAVFATFKKAMT